jgi:hypothetical protein
MTKRKNIWINLSLLNLFIVALLGVLLRTKILFTLPFVDYRNFLSAHGNFALAGWLGLILMTFLVYDILPVSSKEKPVYKYLLAAVFIFSWGIALGYITGGPSVPVFILTGALILTTYVFAWIYSADILRTNYDHHIKLLLVAAMVSLVLSTLGTAAIVLMYLGNWPLKVSYRDASYVFLHFQYNGFFTLGIFGLIAQKLSLEAPLSGNFKKFSSWLSLGLLPSVFLSLLYHEKLSFYVIAAIGGVMLLTSLFYFIKEWKSIIHALGLHPWAKALIIMAVLSYILKLLMQLGTLVPELGHAIYSDRPVIIGFLHLVFLAFASFFFLSRLVEQGYFTKSGKLLKFPLAVFSAGVIANELILMIQGLEILFKTTNQIYGWLLWGSALVLLTGTLLLAASRLICARQE